MKRRPLERDRTVDRLDERTYDVVVIGGGIAGAGVAREATRRGLDTALIERADFAAGTTAASTRLIHGGLRYLEQREFGLVYEGLQEREALADIAPHLVDPIRFVIPNYEASSIERVKRRLGMVLYDVLSYGKSMPRHRHLSSEQLGELEPTLPAEGLNGGFLYHDRQCDFVERLCLETVLDAAWEGADVLNHARATSIRTDGDRTTGVTVRDALSERTISVDGRSVVNAAGPWADEVTADLTDDRFVRPAKGIHLVVPSLTTHALTLPTTDDRVVFVVPWNGMSLVGTTDTDFRGDPSDAVATAADVEYLLDEIGRYLPELDETDVLYTYAGVRPLYDPDGAGDSASVSRAHHVHEHGDQCAGLFSVFGVKITPYRRAARDAVDRVTSYLGVDKPSSTDTAPLPGARGTRTRTTSLPTERLDHIEGLYGARTDDVLERIENENRLAEPLCDHTNDVLAQVTVAVEEEYARRLTDVIFRRCTVGFAECEGRDAVDTVADHMADLLDWSDTRTQTERERYQAVIDRRHAFQTR